MKNVPLTANEIDKIKEVYSQELDRLRKRASELSSMLKKLQRKSEVIEDKTGKKIEKPGKKNKATSVSENKTKVVGKKAKGKRGRPARKTVAKVVAKAEVKTGKKVKRKKAGRKQTAGRSKIVKAQSSSKGLQTNKAKKGKTLNVKKATKVKAKRSRAVKAKTVLKAAKVSKAKKIAKAKPIVAKKGKPGRKKSEASKKSRWTTTIAELLEAQNKLLSSRAIVDEIMKKQNIPAADYSKTRSIVAGSLSDLVLETKKLKTVPLPGQKGKLYGLTEWFDDKGNVLDKSKLS
jgi:hypothetical protein